MTEHTPGKDLTGQVDEQRSYEAVLADAVRVLTEAARRTSTWTDRDGHEHAERADWAEFVTHAVAGAAANVGGVESALAGRPGSWEADCVRQMLHATVGYDSEHLLEHRTEPLVVRVHVDDILNDLGFWASYDQAHAELDRRREAAAEAASAADAAASAELLWHYDRSPDGEWVPVEPAAPAWSWDAWRADLQAAGTPAESIAWVEERMRAGDLILSDPDTPIRAYLPRSPEAGAELRRLDAERDARTAVYDELDERLSAQQQREWAAYGQAFKANVLSAAGELFPALPVPVQVVVELDWQNDDGLADVEWGGPVWRLWEAAQLATPLPGTGGIALRDYPMTEHVSVAQIEREAGRDPLTRLEHAERADQAERAEGGEGQ